MDVNKQINESIKQYKIRLFENKDLYKLNSQDIADLINKETGDNYSESTYRKWYRAYAEGLEDGKKECLSSDELIKEYEIKRTQFEKEKMKFYDQRVAYNKVVRESARYDNFLDVLNRSIKNSKLPIFEYVPRTYEHNSKVMVAAFSDFHYGLEFSNYWDKFNKQIFEERLNKYVSRIIDIAKFNNISDLIILGLGDMISGNIHINLRVANAEDTITQTQEVSEYIANALYELSKHFNYIEYHNVIGNHGRVNANKDESLYIENFERFVPWYCKERLKDIKNVIVCDNEIDQGIVMAERSGNIIVGIHGDKDNIHNAVQNMTLMLGKIPTSVWLGHLHHFASDTVQGVNIVMSGTISGTCDHSKNVRKVGDASQAVGIYNNGDLECLYNVILN